VKLTRSSALKCAFTCALLMLCLVAFSPVANSQGQMMRPPQIMGIWNPTIGAGATYEISGGKEGTSTMTMALVGKEGDGYWIEMSFDTKKGNMLMKMLTTGEGDHQVTRMIMQIPGQQQPIEMSQAMLQSSKDSLQDIHTHGTNMGADTITVPAGTFLCDHWQSQAGDDIWLSPKVPPYGLVKSVNKDGHTMVLTKVVTDAKDKITGKPVSMDDMMRGGGRPH
jgi:hypothetical protein